MMDIKNIDLFGEAVVSWLTIPELVDMHTPMPNNKAAFVFVLKGKCVNYSETDEIKLAKNDAILAKCGNSTFKTLSVDGNTEYSAISIALYKEVLEKIYQDSAPPFFSKTEYPLSVNSVMVESTKLIKQYVNSFLYYFENREALTEEILILKLKELILLLLQTENAPKVLEIMNNLFTKKTFEFKEIIKSHICSSVSIEELAQITNNSLSSFKKEFRRIYDDTPANYIIAKRIEKVAELLLASNETISNIAYDCEFKTLAHLSRVFKVKYGVTPTDYRVNFSITK